MKDKRRIKQNDRGKLRKVIKTISILRRLLVVGIGTAVFIRLQVKDYLFMNAAFAYYTDAERPVLYFVEIIVLMAAVATVGFLINEIMIKIRSKRRM